MKRQAIVPLPVPTSPPADTTTVEQAPAAPPTEAPAPSVPSTQEPRRPVRQASPGPGSSAPTPVPSAPSPAAPAPRLGAILTAEQQRQLNSSIDQSLSRTQATLSSFAQRSLTKEQQGIVDQIQNFIQQAQATRKSDLVAAKSLADRAEVLARDLAGRFR